MLRLFLLMDEQIREASIPSKAKKKKAHPPEFSEDKKGRRRSLASGIIQKRGLMSRHISPHPTRGRCLASSASPYTSRQHIFYNDERRGKHYSGIQNHLF
jgi:hypothetical protein